MKKKDVAAEGEEFSAGDEEHAEEANSGDDWTPEVSKFIFLRSTIYFSYKK